jgi:hypothetical protein
MKKESKISRKENIRRKKRRKKGSNIEKKERKKVCYHQDLICFPFATRNLHTYIDRKSKTQLEGDTERQTEK